MLLGRSLILERNLYEALVAVRGSVGWFWFAHKKHADMKSVRTRLADELGRHLILVS